MKDSGVMSTGALNVLDSIFVCFFVSHVPISLLMDSQAVFPDPWIPMPLKRVCEFWNQFSGDTLVRTDFIIQHQYFIELQYSAAEAITYFNSNIERYCLSS